MTNKEKANTYAQRNFTRGGFITRDALKKHFEKLLNWKEKQMKDKAVEWVDYNNRNGSCLFDGWQQSLKKAMEE